MLTLAFSASDVARIRFAISCLWEVAASLRVLSDPSDHAVHLPWVTRVRSRLDSRLDAGAHSLLNALVTRHPSYMPDFLTPAPTTPTPRLADELAVLLATPAATVRAHVDLLAGPRSSEVQALYDDPATGLERLADEITDYWRVALEPCWPRIAALLEAEVFYRAGRLAEDGAAGLLNDLHQRVRWEGDTLSIAHRYCSARTTLDGSGLLLIPSAFVWPSVLSVSAPDQSQLAYPARGVATLWECGDRTPDALVAVLGKTRAQLLAVLDTPASTTELARRTGMSAGSVSAQLSALRAAGLVTARRSGHAVLNVRTAVADGLLTSATVEG